MSQSLAPDQAMESLRALIAGVPGISSYDIFTRNVGVLRIRASGQDLSHYGSQNKVTLGLRLQNENSCIVSSTTQLHADGLKALLRSARALLRSAGSGAVKRIMPAEEDVVEAAALESSFDTVPAEERVSRVLNMTSNAMKMANSYLRDVKASYEEYRVQEWLWIQGSRRVLSHESQWAEIAVQAVPEELQSSLGVEVYNSKTQYFDLDWSGIAKSAGSWAAQLNKAHVPDRQKLSLLVSNQIMTKLLEAFSHAFLGDRVLRSASFLEIENLGKDIFPKVLNLVDDPERGSRVGHRAWDAEGHRARKRHFVEEGRLLNFAFDNNAGWSEGFVSNHQATRLNPASHPQPGFHSLSIAAGSKDFVDLKREVSDGILLLTLDSFAVLQPALGNFVATFSGIRIKNGVEAEALTRILVSGDLKSFFSKLVSVGRDMTWRKNWGAPSALFDGVEIDGVDQ